LGSFIASCKQDYQRQAALYKIHAVAGAEVYAQFRNAFADRFGVPEIAEREPPRAWRSRRLSNHRENVSVCRTSIMAELYLMGYMECKKKS